MMVVEEKKPAPEPDGPSLDFQPELAAPMKNRFVDALTKVYVVPEMSNAAEVTAFMNNRPAVAVARTHIFDFVMGLRLIVTMDHWHGEALPKMHVSASLQSESEVWWRLAEGGGNRGNRLAIIASTAVDDLAGMRVPLTFLTITRGGAVHLFGPTGDDYNTLARRLCQRAIPEEE